MDVQWYPGHMTKTRRMMEKEISLVDCIIEICDARIPSASRNDTVYDIYGNKPRLLLLNKCDLADPVQTKKWIEEFARRGIRAVAINASGQKDVAFVCQQVRKVLADKIEAKRAKGVNITVRCMVAGIPNSGKSTFINTASKSQRAKTGDTPGVTRAKQWIKADQYLELLDTPGILPPKIRSEEDGILLALTGAVRDQVVDTEELVYILIDRVRALAPGALSSRYKLADEEGTAAELLETICRRRGWLASGGVADTERAIAVLLDEFRGGKFGRITLERCKNEHADA